ncbi:MAG: MerR family transcriptional regulator [Acidobacteria bacterium]|nr:MerR family transcriptional regulator [Acidobacteriota bacterium]
MSPLSTKEIAALVGIHRVTLEEWLRKGKVKSPKKVRIGGQTYRLWTDLDVERLRTYKERFYRKGRGRKKTET